jgi:hypothetical protein
LIEKASILFPECEVVDVLVLQDQAVGMESDEVVLSSTGVVFVGVDIVVTLTFENSAGENLSIHIPSLFEDKAALIRFLAQASDRPIGDARIDCPAQGPMTLLDGSYILCTLEPPPEPPKPCYVCIYLSCPSAGIGDRSIEIASFFPDKVSLLIGLSVFLRAIVVDATINGTVVSDGGPVLLNDDDEIIVIIASRFTIQVVVDGRVETCHFNEKPSLADARRALV